MSFHYGFFNSKGLDRTYTAEDFTEYLSGLVCNGIFDNYGDCFRITANGNKTVTIGTGKAWIDGHYFINDMPFTVNLESYIDKSLDRCVTIGIVCDTNENVRECKIELVPGTASSNVQVPMIPTDIKRKALYLGYVHLAGGTNAITAANIGDYRNDENKCGYVKCILGKCKAAQLQYNVEKYEAALKEVLELREEIKTATHYLFNTSEPISFTKGSDGKMYYYDDNGKMLTGDQMINGIPYHFASNGVLKTEFQNVFGKRYFYDPSTGKIVLGWVTDKGNRYYVTLLEGKLVSQFRTIDGKNYYFNSQGIASECDDLNDRISALEKR